MKLADQLSTLRKVHNFSQEKVAGNLGVTKQAVSKWENGRGYPDIDNLVILSELYEVTLDELIKGDKTFQKKIKIDAKDDQNVAMMIGILIIGVIIYYITSETIFLIMGIVIGIVAPTIVNKIAEVIKR